VKRKDFSKLLELPQVPSPPISKTTTETLTNYRLSLLLIDEDHVKDLKELMLKREAVATEKKRRQLERD